MSAIIAVSIYFPDGLIAQGEDTAPDEFLVLNLSATNAAVVGTTAPAAREVHVVELRGLVGLPKEDCSPPETVKYLSANSKPSSSSVDSQV